MYCTQPAIHQAAIVSRECGQKWAAGTIFPLSAAAVKRGDTIAILNGEKGEWGGRPQVKCGPGTKVVIVSDADDVPEF